VVIPYVLSGTATNGTDYTGSAAAGNLTIATGTKTASVTLTTVTDSTTEGTTPETVILTLGTLPTGTTVATGQGGPITTSINDTSITPPVVAGVDLSLTTGGDVIGPLSGTVTSKSTTGNDKVYGLTAGSLTSADIIDTSDGTDALIADYNFGGADAGTATPTTVTPVLTSVENVTLRNTGTANTEADLFTFNASSSSGLASVTFDQVVGAGTATTLAATNLASTVTTLGVTNNATLAHNYTFQFADAAVADVNNGKTLTVTGDTVATGTVLVRGTTSTASGAGVESLTVNTTGTGTTAASTLGTLLSADGGGATSVLKTLNVTGTSGLTIGSVGFAGTTGGTIVATGMSGDLTLTATTGNEPITFTGGSGKNAITTGAGNDGLTGGANDDTFTIGAGNDTVVGNAGNDRVVLTAISELAAGDSIALGDGARDTLAVGTWASLTATQLTAANKALIAAVTGLEVLELTAVDVIAIDYSAMAQDVVRLSGGDGGSAQAALQVTNVLTNDVLVNNYTAGGVKGTTTSSTLQISGALPNQTFKLELFGSRVGYTNVITAAIDHAVETVSNVTTLAIDSSTLATDTSITVNTIGGALHASAFAIKNTSAQNVVITGNKDLTIANTTANGVTFSNGVGVDAGTFTGKLVIGGSDSNDSLKLGMGNDTVTGYKGSDTIDLSAGGNDTVIFTALNGTDKDTITGFTTGDTINVAALGDGSTGSLDSVITSAAAQAAMTDDRAYIINTTGAAANLTTSGTAVVSDWTDKAQVAAYLNERFTTAVTNESVLVINDTASGHNTTYVYNYVDAGTAASIASTELTLVGTIGNGGTPLASTAVVFA
jgi:hypothetical protein